MEFNQPDVATKLAALRQDLRSTGHADLDWVVDAAAANVATFATDPEWFVQKVVDDVQEYLQEVESDSTWPACPRHPNHPLEYVDKTWRCPRDKATVAGLGDLRQTKAAT